MRRNEYYGFLLPFVCRVYKPFLYCDQRRSKEASYNQTFYFQTQF
jgi:hypothetical protein